MNPTLVQSAAESRARAITASLARHRLVFCQMGAAHEPLRSGVIDELGAKLVNAEEFLLLRPGEEDVSTIVIDALEMLVSASSGHTATLGKIREASTACIDHGLKVLILSRSPRVAFASVPGSSLLEDAALFTVRLLEDFECPANLLGTAGSSLPIVSLSYPSVPVDTALRQILSELGPSVLSAMDHALYEFDFKSGDGLNYLSHREQEALICSGILTVTDGIYTLTVPNRLSELKEALADLLSEIVEPVEGLARITTGLWTIERLIRRALRSAAQRLDGSRWRGSVAPAGLAAVILERAKQEANVAAASVRELRDPTEWLTLGELADLAQSSKFDYLGLERILWRRFTEDLIPVRNRVSHMRLPKAQDEETVILWLKILSRSFTSPTA